jgi:hypothetical protein
MPFLLCLSVATAPSASPAHGGVRLRFDGVYRSPLIKHREQNHYTYIRLYADGVVLVAPSPGSPLEVARWLNVGNKDLARGRYNVAERTIRFSLQVPDVTILPRSDPRVIEGGVVEYEGTAADAALRLRWRSHITDRSGQETFTFVPVSFP